MTGINGNREHHGLCKAYDKFNQSMEDLKAKYKALADKDKKEAAGAAADPSSLSKSQPTAANPMAAAFFADGFDDFDSDMDIDGDLGGDEKRIMCCCKEDTPHDETMKFVLKVSDDYEKTRDKSFNRRK